MDGSSSHHGCLSGARPASLSRSMRWPLPTRNADGCARPCLIASWLQTWGFSRQSASTLSNTVVCEVQTGATHQCTGPAGNFTRRLHPGRLAGLPALSELAAHTDRRRGRSWRGLDHEDAFASALPSHQSGQWAWMNSPTWSKKRARTPHGTPACGAARQPVGSTFAPPPARPGHQVHHCCVCNDTPHAVAGAALSTVICVALWQSRAAGTAQGRDGGRLLWRSSPPC